METVDDTDFDFIDDSSDIDYTDFNDSFEDFDYSIDFTDDFNEITDDNGVSSKMP